METPLDLCVCVPTFKRKHNELCSPDKDDQLSKLIDSDKNLPDYVKIILSVLKDTRDQLLAIKQWCIKLSDENDQLSSSDLVCAKRELEKIRSVVISGVPEFSSFSSVRRAHHDCHAVNTILNCLDVELTTNNHQWKLHSICVCVCVPTFKRKHKELCSPDKDDQLSKLIDSDKNLPDYVKIILSVLKDTRDQLLAIKQWCIKLSDENDQLSSSDLVCAKRELEKIRSVVISGVPEFSSFSSVRRAHHDCHAVNTILNCLDVECIPINLNLSKILMKFWLVSFRFTVMKKGLYIEHLAALYALIECDLSSLRNTRVFAGDFNLPKYVCGLLNREQ
ncbi:hypothetical protein OSTOST_13112 [Ostertagia ostertagi]